MPAKLSIAMPVFNHPEELKTMLDSILANTYQDWELLAIDRKRLPFSNNMPKGMNAFAS